MLVYRFPVSLLLPCSTTGSAYDGMKGHWFRCQLCSSELGPSEMLQSLDFVGMTSISANEEWSATPA